MIINVESYIIHCKYVFYLTLHTRCNLVAYIVSKSYETIYNEYIYYVMVLVFQMFTLTTSFHNDLIEKILYIWLVLLFFLIKFSFQLIIINDNGYKKTDNNKSMISQFQTYSIHHLLLKEVVSACVCIKGWNGFTTNNLRVECCGLT